MVGLHHTARTRRNCLCPFCCVGRGGPSLALAGVGGGLQESQPTYMQKEGEGGIISWHLTRTPPIPPSFCVSPNYIGKRYSRTVGLKSVYKQNCVRSFTNVIQKVGDAVIEVAVGPGRGVQSTSSWASASGSPNPPYSQSISLSPLMGQLCRTQALERHSWSISDLGG